MNTKETYYSRHREEKKAYSRKYAAAHPEERKRYRELHKEQTAQYVKDNALRLNAQARERYKRDDRIKKYKAEYRQRNREKQKSYFAAYYLKHRGEQILRAKEYSKNNPEKRRTTEYLRRARKRGGMLGDPRVIIEWEKRWKMKLFLTCFWCQQQFRVKDCRSDHIIPLSKGGAHSIENLCISCHKCNQSKHAALPSDWNKRLLQPALL